MTPERIQQLLEDVQSGQTNVQEAMQSLANLPFEDLGFKVGDIIRGVNGEEINSPRKAMEAYNTLKSNPNISLKVMRDGREEDFNYSVR